MRRALPVLLLLVLPLAGCGGGEDQAPEAEATTQPVETGAAPPPKQPPVAITEADSGETFALPLGGETNLRLASEYAWDEPVVAGDAVALTRVDYIQDPGFREWVVTAAVPGEATITVHGEPACAGQDGCADAPLDFTVRITVAG